MSTFAGTRFAHVAQDHLLHHLHIQLGSETRCSVLENTWDINDTQIIFFGSTDLQPEDILSEGGLERVGFRAR